MKKVFLLTLLAYFFLWLPTAYAVRMKSLYEVDVPVASQQASLRAEAFRKGLTQVLIRASGNTNIAQNPHMRPSLAHAEALVDEYSYAPSHTPPPAPPYLLQIHFDPSVVNHALRAANAPLWGENRPLIIFWLTNNLSAEGVHIISSDSDLDLTTSLKKTADRRGIPIIFPLMDLSEVGHISIMDIGTNNFAILLNASKRYASDVILAGRLFHDVSGYHLTATLQFQNDQLKWDVTGESVPTVLSGMVDRIADALATRYASVMTEQIQSDVQITITQIEQSTDIDKCLQYLERLPPVASIRILQVNGQSVVLQISLRGTLSSLIEAISTDQHLIPVTNINQQQNPDLIWQWKG
ncbi:MAG: DUF2066 domain-containing protein [Gammaproteobacteria bacterium]|nr:DUF2066 domain-containing protein [Gammaproteobacteria bacterium]